MKKFFNKLVKLAQSQTTKQVFMVVVMMMLCIGFTYAQGAGGFTEAGGMIKSYIGPIKTLIYAIAGCVALVGAIQIFVKMNNGDQDVSKSIMMTIGACVFLVVAAEALPMFFS